ncbi:hypothetical protein ACFXGT_01775, partial [Streptomyces sp. NPDC059352]
MTIMDEDTADTADTEGTEAAECAKGTASTTATEVMGRPEVADEDGPRLPMLLEAVLSVGTDLELRATLQHIVDSATELIGARYGARGGVGPPRPPRPRGVTSGTSVDVAGRGGRPAA